MTKGSKVTAALATATGILALYAAASAQVGGTAGSPTQSDFDTCNREAQILRGGNPPGIGSASPSTVSPGVGSPGVGTGATGGLAAGGAGSAAGATGATGSLSGGSTLSSGSSSITGDMGLRGISPSAQSDPAVQQAYRDCLRRRGF